MESFSFQFAVTGCSQWGSNFDLDFRTLNFGYFGEALREHSVHVWKSSAKQRLLMDSHSKEKKKNYVLNFLWFSMNLQSASC